MKAVKISNSFFGVYIITFVTLIYYWNLNECLNMIVIERHLTMFVLKVRKLFDLNSILHGPT